MAQCVFKIDDKGKTCGKDTIARRLCVTHYSVVNGRIGNSYDDWDDASEQLGLPEIAGEKRNTAPGPRKAGADAPAKARPGRKAKACKRASQSPRRTPRRGCKATLADAVKELRAAVSSAMTAAAAVLEIAKGHEDAIARLEKAREALGA